MKAFKTVLMVICFVVFAGVALPVLASDPEAVNKGDFMLRTSYMKRTFVDKAADQPRPEEMICRADFYYPVEYHAMRKLSRVDDGSPLYQEKMAVSLIIGNLHTAFVNSGWMFVKPEQGDHISDCMVVVVIRDNFVVKAAVAYGPDSEYGVSFPPGYSNVEYFRLVERTLLQKLAVEQIIAY